MFLLFGPSKAGHRGKGCELTSDPCISLGPSLRWFILFIHQMNGSLVHSVHSFVRLFIRLFILFIGGTRDVDPELVHQIQNFGVWSTPAKKSFRTRHELILHENNHSARHIGRQRSSFCTFGVPSQGLPVFCIQRPRTRVTPIFKYTSHCWKCSLQSEWALGSVSALERFTCRMGSRCLDSTHEKNDQKSIPPTSAKQDDGQSL